MKGYLFLCLIGMRNTQSLEVRFPRNRSMLIFNHYLNADAELPRLLYFICCLYYGKLLCLKNKNSILPPRNAIGTEPQNLTFSIVVV